MRYKVHLNTEDPEIIEAFKKIGERSKGKLIEKALVYFLSSKKGKDTVELMAKKQKNKEQHSKKTNEETVKKGKVSSDMQKNEKGKINIDKFL